MRVVSPLVSKTDRYSSILYTLAINLLEFTLGSSDKIPYSKVIANKVVELKKGGVSVKDILAAIQKFQNAPSSSATFYKLYGPDMAEVQASQVSQVGSKVIEQALAGDFKSQELFLRSKGGWSPNATINVDEVDGPADEDTSAIDDLMTLISGGGTKEIEADPDANSPKA